MTTYRNSDMGKVRTCYERLTSEERSCLVSGSLTIAQASRIEQELQKNGLSLSTHHEELRRCVFDDKTDTLEEKVEAKRNVPDKNKAQYRILFTKQGEVNGDIITLIGRLSIAQHVKGSQVAILGAAINYAQHVERDQMAILGAAINYAQHVERDQVAGIAAINYAQHVEGDQVVVLGAAINYAQHVEGSQVAGIAAINYAEEVMKSQYAFSGCAVNIAKRVGKNQSGLLNIITETIKGKQIGLFNYAMALSRGAKQFGLVNLEARHSDRTKKRWTSGPETWWNPEISLFYRKAKEETAQEMQRPKVPDALAKSIEHMNAPVTDPLKAKGPNVRVDVPQDSAEQAWQETETVVEAKIKR